MGSGWHTADSWPDRHSATCRFLWKLRPGKSSRSSASSSRRAPRTARIIWWGYNPGCATRNCSRRAACGTLDARRDALRRVSRRVSHTSLADAHNSTPHSPPPPRARCCPAPRRARCEYRSPPPPPPPPSSRRRRRRRARAALALGAALGDRAEMSGREHLLEERARRHRVGAVLLLHHAERRPPRRVAHRRVDADSSMLLGEAQAVARGGGVEAVPPSIPRPTSRSSSVMPGERAAFNAPRSPSEGHRRLATRR